MVGDDTFDVTEGDAERVKSVDNVSVASTSPTAAVAIDRTTSSPTTAHEEGVRRDIALLWDYFALLYSVWYVCKGVCVCLN